MIPPAKFYEPSDTLQKLANSDGSFDHYYHLQFVQNESLRAASSYNTIINFQIARRPIPPGVTTASIYLNNNAIQTMCAFGQKHGHIHYFGLADIGQPSPKVKTAHLDGDLGWLSTIWTSPVDPANVEVIVSYEYSWAEWEEIEAKLTSP